MTKRINVRKAFTYLLYSIVHCKEFMVEMNWLRNFPVDFSPQKVIQIRLYARKNEHEQLPTIIIFCDFILSLLFFFRFIVFVF